MDIHAPEDICQIKLFSVLFEKCEHLLILRFNMEKMYFKSVNFVFLRNTLIWTRLRRFVLMITNKNIISVNDLTVFFK